MNLARPGELYISNAARAYHVRKDRIRSLIMEGRVRSRSCGHLVLICEEDLRREIPVLTEEQSNTTRHLRRTILATAMRIGDDPILGNVDRRMRRHQIAHAILAVATVYGVEVEHVIQEPGSHQGFEERRALIHILVMQGYTMSQVSHIINRDHSCVSQAYKQALALSQKMEYCRIMQEIERLYLKACDETAHRLRTVIRLPLPVDRVQADYPTICTWISPTLAALPDRTAEDIQSYIGGALLGLTKRYDGVAAARGLFFLASHARIRQDLLATLCNHRIGSYDAVVTYNIERLGWAIA